MADYRSYTDDEKAACLAALSANGGNLAKTARQVGVPRKTLDFWAKQQASVLPQQRPATETVTEFATTSPRKNGVNEVLPVAFAGLAEKLEKIANEICDAMPAKVGTATLSQLAVAAGVAIDKARLLREHLAGSGANRAPIIILEFADAEPRATVVVPEAQTVR